MAACVASGAAVSWAAALYTASPTAALTSSRVGAPAIGDGGGVGDGDALGEPEGAGVEPEGFGAFGVALGATAGFGAARAAGAATGASPWGDEEGATAGGVVAPVDG